MLGGKSVHNSVWELLHDIPDGVCDDGLLGMHVVSVDYVEGEWVVGRVCLGEKGQAHDPSQLPHEPR